MEASAKPVAPPYFAFKTLTNLLTQLEQHGPPTRIDRTVLTSMSGAGQTQFIAGLKSLGLIDAGGVVQPSLVALVTQPEDRPTLIGQIVREHYPDAVALGSGNATTGELLELFREKHGVQGDTARKAIAFYLGAAKYAGDIRLSPNFKTPTIRTGTGSRKRAKSTTNDDADQHQRRRHEDPPSAFSDLHPALAGLLGDLPKRGQTWTQGERDDFMDALVPVLKIAAPIRNEEPGDEPDDSSDEQAWEDDE